LKRPGHSYQATYRKEHPEYEQRNREQQRLRNNRRQKDLGSMIVNTDALMVQLRTMTGSQAFLSSNSG